MPNTTLSAQETLVGRWTGTYGTDNSDGPNFYSFQFHANGQMELHDAMGNSIATGTYTVSGNQLTSTYTYNNSDTYSVAGTIKNYTLIRGTWGSGNNTSGGGEWVMNKKASTNTIPDAFTGRWTGTWGDGPENTPNFYSFQFSDAGKLELHDAAGNTIAIGTYTANGRQFTATYSYTWGDTYSVAGSIDGVETLKGSWGSGTSTTGGGQWVMAKQPAASTNNVSSNSSVYTTNPAKEISTPDGMKLKVQLDRNPSTGANPVIRKINSGTLPQERNNGWTTEVKRVYLTAESTTFMNASNTNAINIVPGSIYKFEDFIGGANNEILGNRNPIRIYTDNQLKPGSTGGVVINTPSAYEILQGNGGDNLNAIRNSIVESSGGIRFFQQSFTSNTEAELSLKVTAGGSYGGFTASGGYNLKQNGNRLYITIDAVKPMYSIKAEKPLAGFFSTTETTPNKVYIKEVNYGSRVLANVEIILESREDIINFKAAYEGSFKADIGMDFINKSKNKNEKVNAYLIGAPVTATTFNKDQLATEINALLATCSFQHAMPISFTLGDMDGNTIATRSATDEIIERNSIPDNLIYRLQEAAIEVQTGNDNKEWQSKVAMELYSGNGNILMYQPKENSNFEFPVQQATRVGLMLHPHANLEDFLYNNIKTAGGLRVRVFYWANFFADAWRIDGVRLKLKFVDQNNVPLPSTPALRLDGSGFLNLDCANAVQTLDGFDRRVLECFIDGNFTPTTSTVKRD